MKIGLLFAGQGAQYPGMGKDLYEGSAAAKEVFDIAGEDIKEICFNGSAEALKQTQVTQPCVYIVTMAAYMALVKAAGSRLQPAGVAGFSLGEYSALTAAGVIDDIKKGLGIVSRRGELMMGAGTDENGDPKGGMAAALGKRQDILACVESARGNGILEGVNFNTPAQTVVAGDLCALARFKEKATENRIRVVPLSVSTAFHTPMMRPAADKLRQLLLMSELKKPALKVYCNVSGKELTGSAAEIMAKQAESPVLWQETIENMASDGIGAMIEIGPGTALSGMVRKIAPQMITYNVEDMESLKKTTQALAGMFGAEGGK